MGPKGTADYNATAGKFNEVKSYRDYDIGSDLSSNNTGLDMVPFAFVDAADFKARVDLSLAGNMMDCGECHVGGGAMEFLPVAPDADLNTRIPLRSLSAGAVIPGFGGTVAGAPVTPADYTAFNYFIDTYDVDGDFDAVANVGGENEVQFIDYTRTGVMEMDCLMCHLPGYKYKERKFALRQARIDATRAIGAGFAEASPVYDADGHMIDVTGINGLSWGPQTYDINGTPFHVDGAPVGYGTTVSYDADNASMFYPVASDQPLVLKGSWMADNVAAKPDSTNCANCHMNEFSVDWKKRGDHWAPNDPVSGDPSYDYDYEVHYMLGCMGCHERTDKDFNSVDSFAVMSATDKTLGHDPAKGDSPYSGLFNKNDKASYKSCEDCHGGGTDGQSYGAMDPTAAHAAAGLTAKIVQAATADPTVFVDNMDGTAEVSHIDLLHCSACHTRNVDNGTWNNTGAPLIDATGGDLEKRLTDHENDYIKRQDMTDNTSLAWYKNKLLRVNPSATMFWRDKNDLLEGDGGLDANEDGRENGMDALLMTQVLETNRKNGWGSITEDHHGEVTTADFAERISALAADVTAWTKTDAATNKPKIKFSIFHVNFQEQHGVSPAFMAWGSGRGNDPTGPIVNANGCKDCHDANSNFYNGSIDTTGTNNSMTYGTSTSQRVPFTKVNGFSQATDWHPGQKNKKGQRSIALQISNTPTTVDPDGVADSGDEYAALTTREVKRYENIYESTFMKPAAFQPEYVGTDISAAVETATENTKGWQMIVQVQNLTDLTVKTYLRMIGTDYNTVEELISGAKGLGPFKNVGNGFNFIVTGVDLDNADLDDDATTGDFEALKVAATDANYKVRLKAGNAASFGLIDAAYTEDKWVGVADNSIIPAEGTADRDVWLDYLNSLADKKADLGIGADPQAVIDAAVPASVEINSTVNLAADQGVNSQGTFTYSWTTDMGIALEGEAPAVLMDKLGAWTFTLKVEDEEGKVAYASKTINVTNPVPTGPVSYDAVAGEVSFNELPASYTRLYVIWGDGARGWYNLAPPATSIAHNYATPGDKLVTAYVYDGYRRVSVERGSITVP